MSPETDRATFERVDAAISRLPRRQRMAFLLAARDGLSYAEIAFRLAVSTREVEKLIARALCSIDRQLR
jgi:RNA polymerase sigma factor (sigma-70 family)